MNKNQIDNFQPLIYAIVAVFNNIEDCKIMVDGFFSQNYLNKHLVVVNNGNSENAFQFLTQYKSSTIIHIEENKGWAVANNIGIEFSINNKAEYVLLLNDDVVFENCNLLNELIANISANKTSDYINSIVIKESDFNKIIETSGYNIFNKSKYPIIKQKEKFTSNEILNFCDFTSGAFMLIPANIIKQVGLFDTNLFCYAEDKDFCFRAWQKDFPSVVYNNLFINHKGSASSREQLSFKTYYFWRNFFYFLHKHKSEISHYAYFKRKKIRHWLKQFIIILKNNYPYNTDSKGKMCKALFLAAHHGLITHKVGKYWKIKNKI